MRTLYCSYMTLSKNTHFLLENTLQRDQAAIIWPLLAGIATETNHYIQTVKLLQ